MTRSQFTTELNARITDPKNQQNSAVLLREVFELVSANWLNLEDDADELGGSDFDPNAIATYLKLTGATAFQRWLGTKHQTLGDNEDENIEFGDDYVRVQANKLSDSVYTFLLLQRILGNEEVTLSLTSPSGNNFLQLKPNLGMVGQKLRYFESQAFGDPLDIPNAQWVQDLVDGSDDYTDTQIAALESTIADLGVLVGGFDASSGALPTTGSGESSAIDKGDYWKITVAGTLSGIGQLKVGDVLIASINNASVAADFFALQNNVDQATSSILGLVKLYNDLTAFNTDGTVTQAAIKAAVEAKQNLAPVTVHTVVANYTVPDFTAPEKAVNGTSKIYKIIGNNVNSITIQNTWVNTNGALPSPFSTNYVFAEVVDGKVCYYIIKESLATPITPNIMGATTSYDGYKVYLTYDKSLGGTPSYTISGSISVASYLITNNILIITTTTPLISGAAYTVSGSGLTDLETVPNACPTLSTYTIVNNTAPNLKSLSNGASPDLVYATAVKLQLCAGAGGTDLVHSGVMRVRRKTSGVQVNFLSHPSFQFGLNNSNQLQFTMVQGGNYIAQFSTATIPFDVWTYVGYTYSASKTAAGIKLYINGALAASTALSSGYTGGATGSVVTLLPGNTSNTNWIDEIAILSLELTAGNISTLYNSGVVFDYRTSAFNSNLLFYVKADNSMTDLSASPTTLSTGTPTYQTSIP